MHAIIILFAGHDPAPGSVFQKPADRVGSGQEVLENVMGRVGSGQLVSKYYGSGSGHRDPIRPAKRGSEKNPA